MRLAQLSNHIQLYADCGEQITWSAGDLISKSEANGNVSCNYYDGLHRLTTAAAWTSGLNNGLCRRFAYDITSNGVLGSAPAGVTVNNIAARLMEAETDNCAWPITQSSMITDEWLGYSVRGENTDLYESTPHSGRYYHSSAGYFANGALQSLSFFGQSGYSYGVDGEGRPYTAAQGANQLVTSTSYTAASQPLTVSLKLGDSDNYAYDPNTGRMSNYTFTVGSTPKSMIGGLTWNANGTLSKLQITDGFNASGTQTCKYGDPSSSVPGYDDLGRLISTNCGTPWSQTFSYDPFGNITKSGSVAWMPGYNQSTNRYTLGGTSYDASGNLLNDTFHTYSWDGFGKVLSVDSTACGTNGTCFTYDASGQLVEKNTAGAYSQIEYSPVGKVAVLNSGGTWVRGYVPLPGGEILAPGPDTFWHRDWLGSVRLASSAPNRTITFDRAFAPFGEMYNTVTCGTTNPDFAGLTRDAISDEGDTPNREYHQKQGRWISPDPLGMGAADPSDPQSWNLYAYVMNNPLLATDPSGLQCVEYEGIVGDDEQPPTCDHMTPPTGIPDSEVDASIEQALAMGQGVGWSAWNELLQAAQSLTSSLQSATNAVAQFITAPRNPACMAGTMGSGSAIGFGVGGLVGSPGFALGPVGVATESVTIPLGTGLGATGGYLTGLISCRTAGGGGSGSGGGSDSSQYQDVTKSGSVRNIKTNVSPAEFGKNLQANGFTKSVSKDGLVEIYTKGDTKYAVYPVSNSTGGPSAQMMVNGQTVLKIRF